MRGKKVLLLFIKSVSHAAKMVNTHSVCEQWMLALRLKISPHQKVWSWKTPQAHLWMMKKTSDMHKKVHKTPIGDMAIKNYNSFSACFMFNKILHVMLLGQNNQSQGRVMKILLWSVLFLKVQQFAKNGTVCY